MAALRAAGSMEFSAEHFGRLDFPPSILGRELLVPSCAHAVMPGFSRLTPQVRLLHPLQPFFDIFFHTPTLAALWQCSFGWRQACMRMLVACTDNLPN